MSDEIEISVNGKKHSAWESCSVTLQLDAVADSFEMRYADRWLQDGESFPILEGDEVNVSVAGERVLSGYAEDFEAGYNKESAQLSCSGRSRTGDLLDCSDTYPAVIEQTMQQIAESLCEPFGIAVEVDPALLADAQFAEPLEQFQVELGETVGDALRRLARQRGVLLSCTPAGDLLITRAGTRRITEAAIRYGENVLSGSCSASTKERFSRYTVKGQMPGSDQWHGKQAATVNVTVDDDGAPRHRPTVMFADDGQGFEWCKKRATFERNQAAGRAERFTYTVQGWRTSPKPQKASALAIVDALGASSKQAPTGIWYPNALVTVQDGRFGVDGELLIASVTYAWSLVSGRVTTLELMSKEAFDVLVVPERKRKKRRKGGKDKLGAAIRDSLR